MDAKIEINGDWIDCLLSYPNQEPPLSVPGPPGTTHWQQSSYSRFNAKLSFTASSPIIPPGSYKIRFGGKEHVFESQKPEHDIVWGNVL